MHAQPKKRFRPVRRSIGEVGRPSFSSDRVYFKVEPGLWTGLLLIMPDYPGRPTHVMPGWVKAGTYYHIRIRTAHDNPIPLTNDKTGRALLDSATLYHERARWHCHLFLLMPDHLHALLAFPPDTKMSSVIGTWKSFQAKQHGIHWQGNYFDHRIRTDKELEEKAAYIRKNPVVKGLSANEADWPWVLNCPA